MKFDVTAGYLAVSTSELETFNPAFRNVKASYGTERPNWYATPMECGAISMRAGGTLGNLLVLSALSLLV